MAAASATRRLAKLARHAIGQDGCACLNSSSSFSSKAEAATAGPGLARLPLPTVDATATRFLEVVKPLLNEQQQEEAMRLVDAFRVDPTVAKLQQHLEHEAAAPPLHNYMRRFWEHMYLTGRYPLPLNSNPASVFADCVCVHDQSLQAARVAAHFGRFIQASRRGWRGPDFEGTTPQCMDQAGRMFGTTRIPQLGKDLICTIAGSRHITVLRHDRFYAIELLDVDEDVYTVEELHRAFQYVLNDDERYPANPKAGVGILTTYAPVVQCGGTLTLQHRLPRDEWAMLYQQLLNADPGNTVFFDTVHSSLFSLSLDAAAPADLIAAARQYLCGGTAACYVTRAGQPAVMDGYARWYDKSIQLIVCANGQTGLNMEHSWGDGAIVTRMHHEAMHDLEGTASGYAPLAARWSRRTHPGARKLALELPAGMSSNIVRAAASMAQRVDNLDLAAGLVGTGITRDAIKRWRLSPDAFVQMSIQAAAALAIGHGAGGPGTGIGTYESLNMRHYSGGRTETIRVVTPESQAFVRACVDASTSREQLVSLLRAAADAHKRRTSHARNGEGVDRHLFALKMAAAELKEPLPALLASKPYELLSTNTLSTSAVLSDMTTLATFGPVELRGYGCSYMMGPAGLVVNTTCNKTEPGGTATGCDAAKFLKLWGSVLRQMATALDAE